MEPVALEPPALLVGAELGRAGRRRDQAVMLVHDAQLAATDPSSDATFILHGAPPALATRVVAYRWNPARWTCVASRTSLGSSIGSSLGPVAATTGPFLSRGIERGGA
jgi:hypothetical protein